MEKGSPKALKSDSDFLVYCEKEEADFCFPSQAERRLLSLFSVGVNSTRAAGWPKAARRVTLLPVFVKYGVSPVCETQVCIYCGYQR